MLSDEQRDAQLAAGEDYRGMVEALVACSPPFREWWDAGCGAAHDGATVRANPYDVPGADRQAWQTWNDGWCAGAVGANKRLRDALRGLLAVFTCADEQCLVEIEVSVEYPNQPASARHRMGSLYPSDEAKVAAARAALGETDG